MTLIQGGADINLASKVQKFGMTYHRSNRVDVLCLQGGKRPIDQARYEGQDHIVCILKKAENV